MRVRFYQVLINDGEERANITFMLLNFQRDVTDNYGDEDAR